MDATIPDDEGPAFYARRVDCGSSRHAGLSEALLVRRRRWWGDSLRLPVSHARPSRLQRALASPAALEDTEQLRICVDASESSVSILGEVMPSEYH